MTDSPNGYGPGGSSVVALILAGGLGRRMGRPKQFIELLGRPALLHTLEAFQDAPEVERVYTVGDSSRIRSLVEDHGMHKFVGCALPGESRSHSTQNGLDLMEREGPETVVLIHDGSRCLISPDLIGRLATALNDGSDGAIPAVSVSDTIKVTDGNDLVSRTLDRSELRAVQTPQVFLLGRLREVFSSSEEFLASATDDASLIERSGGSVRLVMGEKTNIKLTSPEDVVLAEAILRSRGKREWPSRKSRGSRF